MAKSFVGRGNWQSALRLRYPHIVQPNTKNSIFQDQQNSPDFQGLLVTFIDVNDGDVLNAGSVSGKFWFRLRPQKMEVITANDYTKVWDDSNIGVSEELGLWHPKSLPEYRSLGDFAERSHLAYPLTHNFESPNNMVICAAEDELQYVELGPEDEGFGLAPRLLSQPSKFEKIWDNRLLVSKSTSGPITLLRPLPSSPDYASLGCIATTKPQDSESLRSSIVCVHKSVLLLGTRHDSGDRFQDGSLWSTYEVYNGNPESLVSLWEAKGLQGEGVSAGGFIAAAGNTVARKNVPGTTFVLNISPTPDAWRSQ